jgi:hypothetical protein
MVIYGKEVLSVPSGDFLFEIVGISNVNFLLLQGYFMISFIHFLAYETASSSMSSDLHIGDYVIDRNCYSKPSWYALNSTMKSSLLFMPIRY